jgi:hydroxymethylglutaryl-CoA reductase (NADPH)
LLDFGLSKLFFSDELLSDLCAATLEQNPQDAQIEISSFKIEPLGTSQGVISSYQKSTSDRLVGLFVLSIDWKVAHSDRSSKFLIKSKVPGDLIRRKLESVYERFDPRLAELQRSLAPSILDKCHIRELAILDSQEPSLRSCRPQVFKVWRDDSRGIFAVALEVLTNVRHLETIDNLDVWNFEDIQAILRAVAEIHAEFFGKIDPSQPPEWLERFEVLNNTALLSYQRELLAYNARTFPQLFDKSRRLTLETLLDQAPERRRTIRLLPLTLIHGDLTPRNVCLRTGIDGSLNACLYDWELAQLHLPQRDICEFLVYVLRPGFDWAGPALTNILHEYMQVLSAKTGKLLDFSDFRGGLALGAREFATFKMLTQGISHQLLGRPEYFRRIVSNTFDLLAATE